MKILYISGSPRVNGNTEYLLNISLSITGGEFIRLKDLNIKPCSSCWNCIDTGTCVVQDEMTNKIMPYLSECDGIVLGSPVFFNNVSSIMKAFIDRTWCLKGVLRNKLGGAIAVGRGYGIEGAITAMNAFFLKHEIVVVNRGVSGFAFKKGEIAQNQEAIQLARNLGERILEMDKLFT